MPPLFRFWRGSTRVKVIDPGTNTALVSTIGYNVNSGLNSYPITFNQLAPSGNICLDQPTVVVPSLSGGAEYEVPYYSITHASHPVVFSGTGTGVSVTRDATDNQINLYVTQNTVFSPQTRVFRAAGDDFSLGFFIGTLPLTSAQLF